MFTRHGLFQIPLASPDLEAAFTGQLICKYVREVDTEVIMMTNETNSEGVYEAGPKGVLVVFVHDL